MKLCVIVAGMMYLALNKGDWFWCPRNKDFECSKQITSSMVIEHIKKLI